eukprot:TRINITY_DN1809_c0_g1_i2.p1 TRINITY_DN1809_c0_g1~~TRINITY_DN1809_c0_g1_i2.p1  ORF type:complete len:226 (-),score=38.78 TRINITY_DN1809_c0_g1_i2:120-797(-)
MACFVHGVVGAVAARLLLCYVRLSFASASDVIILTDDTFHDMVEDGKGNLPWFVEFYAPWCGHCKALKHEYDQLPAMVEGVAHVAMVDATTEKAVATEFGIEGYPSLRLIAGGRVYPYSGAREAKAMARWLSGGWGSGISEKVPKDKTVVDLVVDRFKKDAIQLLSDAEQVHKFMPSIIPIPRCAAVTQILEGEKTSTGGGENAGTEGGENAGTEGGEKVGTEGG